MDRYMLFPSGMGQHQNGSYVLFADAQATIAALQARVKELQCVADEKCRCFLERAEQAEQQLTQRTEECDALKLVNDTHMKTVMKLSHIVEKHTAELEAAKGKLDIILRVSRGEPEDELAIDYGGLGWENDPAVLGVYDLIAELERVRADNKALDKWRADVTVSLQRPGGAFFVDVPQHIKDLVKERDDLRTLVVALPKVEVVTGDTVVNIVQQYNFHQWMLRALQHRQGMEG